MGPGPGLHEGLHVVVDGRFDGQQIHADPEQSVGLFVKLIVVSFVNLERSGIVLIWLLERSRPFSEEFTF